jgi:hypothetical protein
MNNKLLLVKCITLLYRESLVPGQSENSAALVREIISDIQLAEVNVGVDRERDVLDGLRSTALSMADMPIDHQYELNELLQRLRIVCIDDETLYETLMEGMAPELGETTLKRTCMNHKKALANYLKEKHINRIVNEASFQLKFQRSKISDIKKWVAEMVSKLEPYQVEAGDKDPAVIDDIDTSNENAVSGVFETIKDINDGTTVLKTGFQGLNRMLDGGFRRGEEWVIGALQHNFKTGFSLTIFQHIALFNKPIMLDKNKKPLLLRISFEDGLALNFQYLYQNLMENETGIVPDVENVPVEEMARYVKEKLSVNGYNTRFMHVNPSLWTYRDVCNKILELEADGYEIHMCMLDYLLKLPTTGCDQGPAGHDIRNMYERIKNFMMARGICVITPHQLSTDAKMQMREGREDFVKNLVGGGYYAGSKQIDQVVDGEIFIHIVEINNQSWLTVQRGKHRKIKQTPKENLYMALPFSKSGLLYDVGKADTTRKKAGGGPIGTKDEMPFWAANEPHISAQMGL